MKQLIRFLVPAAFVYALLLQPCYSQAMSLQPPGIDREKSPRIFSASSLGALLKSHSEHHPATLILGASTTLAVQIAQGAQADVLISADRLSLRYLPNAAAKRPVEKMACNTLIIAARAEDLQPDAKASVKDFQSALRNAGRVATGYPDYVPLGHYTRQALIRAKIWKALRHKIVTANSAREALHLLKLGQVDRAILYASDISQHDELIAFAEIPKHFHDQVQYYAIALTKLGQQWLRGLTANKDLFNLYGFKRCQDA